jgi:hypothetical protein
MGFNFGDVLRDFAEISLAIVDPTAAAAELIMLANKHGKHHPKLHEHLAKLQARAERGDRKAAETIRLFHEGLPPGYEAPMLEVLDEKSSEDRGFNIGAELNISAAIESALGHIPSPSEVDKAADVIADLNSGDNTRANRAKDIISNLYAEASAGDKKAIRLANAIRHATGAPLTRGVPRATKHHAHGEAPEGFDLGKTLQGIAHVVGPVLSQVGSIVPPPYGSALKMIGDTIAPQKAKAIVAAASNPNDPHNAHALAAVDALKNAAPIADAIAKLDAKHKVELARLRAQYESSGGGGGAWRLFAVTDKKYKGLFEH